jgi:uroporphyrinogen decarboxylase
VTVQPVRRLGVDAAIIFSDILIPTEAMGMELGARRSRAALSLAAADRRGRREARVPRSGERTGFVAEAIRRTRAALHDSVPVIGFAGAPVHARRVHGWRAAASKSFILIKRLLFEQPKLAHALFERLTRTLIPYLEMQVEAGARIVQIFDSWGGELRPRATSRPSASRT